MLNTVFGLKKPGRSSYHESIDEMGKQKLEDELMNFMATTRSDMFFLRETTLNIEKQISDNRIAIHDLRCMLEKYMGAGQTPKPTSNTKARVPVLTPGHVFDLLAQLCRYAEDQFTRIEQEDMTTRATLEGLRMNLEELSSEGMFRSTDAEELRLMLEKLGDEFRNKLPDEPRLSDVYDQMSETATIARSVADLRAAISKNTLEVKELTSLAYDAKSAANYAYSRVDSLDAEMRGSRRSPPARRATLQSSKSSDHVYSTDESLVNPSVSDPTHQYLRARIFDPVTMNSFGYASGAMSFEAGNNFSPLIVAVYDVKNLLRNLIDAAKVRLIQDVIFVDNKDKRAAGAKCAVMGFFCDEEFDEADFYRKYDSAIEDGFENPLIAFMRVGMRPEEMPVIITDATLDSKMKLLAFEFFVMPAKLTIVPNDRNEENLKKFFGKLYEVQIADMKAARALEATRARE